MRIFYVTACLVAVSLPMVGQSDRGTITGTVVDPANALIANAALVAINTETAATFPTVSTSTGAYTLVGLPAGVYNLEVSSPGFAKLTQQGIRVQVATTARIDITLRLSSTTDSVTVVADAPMLKTESGEQSHNITTDQILRLPLYGGSGRGGASGFRHPYAFLTTMVSRHICKLVLDRLKL